MFDKSIFYSLIIFFSISAAIFHISKPAVASGNSHKLDHQCTIFVQKGDTYIGLFGSDWDRVLMVNMVKTNENALKNDDLEPYNLAVGTKLVVPAMTCLTNRALKRINMYQNNKRSAEASIKNAEKLMQHRLMKKSEAYNQGCMQLEKAKKVISSSTFNFTNYQVSEQFARNAVKYFKVAEELYQADTAINEFKAKVEDEQKLRGYLIKKLEKNMLVQKFLRQQVQAKKIDIYRFIACTGASGFVLLIVFALIMHKQKVKKNQFWLKQHKQNLTNLEKFFNFKQ